MEMEARSEGNTLLDQERYDNLLSCLRGYEMDGRDADDGNES